MIERSFFPLLYFLSVFLFLSCSNNNTVDNEEKINIRLYNASTYNYEEIIINTSTGPTHFGNLAAGKYSFFIDFDIAYNYAFVEFKKDGQIYTLQPRDFVGEEPLEKGFYTYLIEFEQKERFNSISMRLFREINSK